MPASSPKKKRARTSSRAVAPAKGARRKWREPVQERAEETRTRILQTAREVFAEHGFAGANIRDIALAANSRHSMITYHFGSKEGLWREAVRDMFARSHAILNDTVLSKESTSSSLLERFRNLTRSYVRYCSEHPEHARITIGESIRGGERLEWMVREFVKIDHQLALPMLTELMDKGLVPKMPLPSLMYAFVGMCQLPFVLAKECQLAFGYNMMSESAINQHTDAVLALLLAGSGKSAP